VKSFLFRIVAIISASLIAANLAIGNAISELVANIFNGINSAIKFLSERLMIAIDSDRYNHASLAINQSGELMELKLLAAANRVKEDAVKTRVWTINHTIAINKIANALFFSCRWEKERIHGYFKPLVESIPGMSYMPGDDFDNRTTV